MAMPLGPIFTFDLVTSARRRRYFLLRVLYALILMLVVWIMFADQGYRARVTMRDAAAFAEQFFAGISMVQMCAVLLVGPALAAGTVALERERRTIEYLFATDLSNSEIVLGKLVSRLLHLGVLIAAGLPITALVMLLGGISPEQLVIVYSATLSTMIVVITVSVAVSVRSSRARDAVVAAYLAVFALVAFPPILYAFWREIFGYGVRTSWIDWALEQSLELNPFYVFEILRRPGSWPKVAKMVAAHLTLAALCIGFALTAVRRIHLREMGPHTKAVKRRRIIHREMEDEPMLWKELFADQARLRLGTITRSLIALIAMGYLAMAWWMAHKPTYGAYSRNAEELTATTAALVCLGLLMIAARSATAVTSEKDRQCWEPLLLTSLTGSEIIGAKIWGNLYAASGLMLLALLGWGMEGFYNPAFLPVIPFELATVFVLMLFVSTLGVYCSLHARDSLRAIAMTLSIGIFVGGGYLFCCLAVIIPGHFGRESEVVLAFAMPFLIFFPTQYYHEWMQQNAMQSSYARTRNEMFAAFVIGMFCYLAAALILWAACVTKMNRAQEINRDRGSP